MFDDVNDKWKFFHCLLTKLLNVFLLLHWLENPSNPCTPWFIDSISDLIGLRIRPCGELPELEILMIRTCFKG